MRPARRAGGRAAKCQVETLPKAYGALSATGGPSEGCPPMESSLLDTPGATPDQQRPQVRPGACCQSRVWWSGGARCGVRGAPCTRRERRWAGTGGSNRGQARLRRGRGPTRTPMAGLGARRWASFLTSYAMAAPSAWISTLSRPRHCAPAAARDGPSVRRWPSRPSTRAAPAALGGWRAEIGDDSVAQSPIVRAHEGAGGRRAAALRLDRARPADLRPPAVDQATGRPGSARGALAGEGSPGGTPIAISDRRRTRTRSGRQSSHPGRSWCCGAGCSPGCPAAPAPRSWRRSRTWYPPPLRPPYARSCLDAP